MNRLPSTQTLVAFEAAARHRSYSRAAIELSLTHGAISQRIRELEQHAGGQLFTRVGRSMVPTDFAQVLLAQVRAALTLLDRAFLPRARASRTIRLSVLPPFASRWLLPRLPDWRARHPDIDLEIDATTHLALPGGHADLAIRYGPGGWPGVHATRLREETLTPVCTPEYRARHDLQKPEDLARATLLRNPWQPWAPWLWAAGLVMTEPHTGPVYADTGLILQAACAGEGVALARELLIQDDLDFGRLVRPFPLKVTDTYAYYLVRFEPTQAQRDDIEAFADWLTLQLGADRARDASRDAAA